MQAKHSPGDAKWENTMWDVFMDIGSEWKVTVMSGSVVIGFVVIRPEDLGSLPIDIEGLTVFDSLLKDGSTVDDQVEYR